MINERRPRECCSEAGAPLGRSGLLVPGLNGLRGGPEASPGAGGLRGVPGGHPGGPASRGGRGGWPPGGGGRGQAVSRHQC